VYVTGYSAGNGTGDDIATLKYNTDGQLLWVQRYDGPKHLDDRGTAIAVDADGNVYVTGECEASETAGDWITLKYDVNGNLLWFQQYGTPEAIDQGQSLEVDEDGNVYVAGTGAGMYVTIKYSAEGILLWERREGSYDSEADAIVRLDGNGFPVVASRVAVVKYDAEGDIWRDSVRFPVTDMALNQNGLVCVTGDVDGLYITTVFDADGNKAWETVYRDLVGQTNKVESVRIDAAGNVYLTGMAYQGYTLTDYMTLKYDTEGHLLWMQSYDYAGDVDNAAALEIDADGGVYVTGLSTSSSYTDYATIKYSTDGELLWERRYDGPSAHYDGATDLEVDSAGNIYVTGYSIGEGSNYDYATIKYIPDTTAPRLTIGVLQNPVLPSHIEIQAVADEPLYESVVLEVNGVRLTTVDEPGELDNTFTARYQLSGSEVITLRAVCLDRAMNRTEVTDSFESFPVDGGGGLLAAFDGTVRLDIPPNALAGSHHVLLFRESASTGTRYDFRPNSLRLDRPGELRIDVRDPTIDPASVAIFRQGDAGDWEQLSTFVDPGSGALVAFVDRLGIFEVRATAGAASAPLPRAPLLEQNYPNPFNAGTIIAFTLDRPCRATLEVFNVLGQHVTTLTDRDWPAGTHQIGWDGNTANGRTVASGVYYYRLRTPSATETRRMVLIK
ncbi:MAG TPA: SBBP repeat-containing protein, partial [Acidobacteriota bacterium]|nr:SBBP repeat-containing protein [Acidobacteriota bacterium]